MELWALGIWLLLLLLDQADANVRGILCNYCFNADRVEDCTRSARRCQPGDVCFIDESKITYNPSGMQNEKSQRTVYMFKMGCTFHGMCKDGISYGPGPLGYSNIKRQCCCSDRCLKTDGVGDGNYEHCSSPVANLTITDDAWSLRPSLTASLLIAVWTTSLYLKLL